MKWGRATHMAPVLLFLITWTELGQGRMAVSQEILRGTGRSAGSVATVPLVNCPTIYATTGRLLLALVMGKKRLLDSSRTKMGYLNGVNQSQPKDKPANMSSFQIAQNLQPSLPPPIALVVWLGVSFSFSCGC